MEFLRGLDEMERQRNSCIFPEGYESGADMSLISVPGCS